MPRDRYYADEERIYHVGFRDGWAAAMKESQMPGFNLRRHRDSIPIIGDIDFDRPPAKKKRKISDWNKFVKANSKKKQFRYASGKVNLKKLGVAYRKKKRSR